MSLTVTFVRAATAKTKGNKKNLPPRKTVKGGVAAKFAR